MTNLNWLTMKLHVNTFILEPYSTSKLMYTVKKRWLRNIFPLNNVRKNFFRIVSLKCNFTTKKWRGTTFIVWIVRRYTFKALRKSKWGNKSMLFLRMKFPSAERKLDSRQIPTVFLRNNISVKSHHLIPRVDLCQKSTLGWNQKFYF